MKVTNNLDNLISILQGIKDKYPNEDIEVAVNLMGDRVFALQSVCLDNEDPDLGIQLFFETTTDECAEIKPTFEFYAQGEDVPLTIQK